MAGEYILVIEDEASVRTLLEKSLSSRGYRVQCCEDGLAGLTALESAKPDLIIVDIMMPRLDGMTFVKAIKGNGETKPIPVIFLTAKNDPKTMIVGINLGARFYVTKPFVIDDLLSKVQKALT
ncbi:MAG: response regulator [Deltaproteobacteria bacterium]|nr:response regulator [Deltaproteobacteria bacterium]MBK8237692.1 response regulator [Deltaproteobacteria bacterium]MBP7291758.1 response regulator [Nannocystaceae bacterium]